MGHIIKFELIYKSSGPENLHPYVLKATSMEILPILTHLFQQSLNSGMLPAQWKHAYIIPIHIKGDRMDPKNYCLISLTSIVCKIKENQQTKHLEVINIYFYQQSIWL